jgi:hypothetical protein
MEKLFYPIIKTEFSVIRKTLKVYFILTLSKNY